jgi:hypothetical protein
MTQDPRVHFFDVEGLEIFLPGKYVVCPRCEGHGSHVNPNIDGNGLTADDFMEDPDFMDDYLTGVYDVSCYECNGLRVVVVLDEERTDPELVKAYREYQRDEAAFNAEWMAEIRMGA